YQAAGYRQPKPLIPVSGRPMIERLLEVFPSSWPTYFVLAENHLQTKLPAALQALRPGATQTAIPAHSKGPGQALETVLPKLDPAAPVLVTYCDYGMVWDAARFEQFVAETQSDACLLSYRGFHAHYLSPQTYAYSRMEGPRVVEVREKGSFTQDRENEFASAGGYYFRTARLLGEALAYQRAHKLEVGGELYTSLTVEALLRLRPSSKVTVFEVPAFYQWGTPDQLQTFEYWESGFAAANEQLGDTGEVAQVLMPMAGKGSRFEGITLEPKPLVPVGEKPMFKSALDTLPRAAQRTVVVALKDFSSKLRPWLRAEDRVVELETTPPGQALSTEAGLSALDPKQEVLVSSCDHGIALKPARWSAFRADPRCDAAIFTVRGYPGALRRPKAYAYVESATGGEAFPEVQRVSVKQPLSETPHKDAVLVGTFWFRTAEVMRDAIALLKARDLRVNGELYLDSVFELMRDAGQVVREVPLDGYFCWGEPDAMAETLYWQERFTGRALVRRPRLPGVTHA
ncbi:MAG: NTP transferase domain-containing protein, partial [Myxococcaceae bacterium]